MTSFPRKRESLHSRTKSDSRFRGNDGGVVDADWNPGRSLARKRPSRPERRALARIERDLEERLQPRCFSRDAKSIVAGAAPTNIVGRAMQFLPLRSGGRCPEGGRGAFRGSTRSRAAPIRVTCRSCGTPFGPASPFGSASCLRSRHLPPLRRGRKIRSAQLEQTVAPTAHRAISMDSLFRCAGKELGSER
jgi:hypothetical protein